MALASGPSEGPVGRIAEDRSYSFIEHGPLHSGSDYHTGSSVRMSQFGSSQFPQNYCSCVNKIERRNSESKLIAAQEKWKKKKKKEPQSSCCKAVSFAHVHPLMVQP